MVGAYRPFLLIHGGVVRRWRARRVRRQAATTHAPLYRPDPQGKLSSLPSQPVGKRLGRPIE